MGTCVAPAAGPVAAILRPPGGVPERSKGIGCKPIGYAFAGSNPAPTTRHSEAGLSVGLARLFQFDESNSTGVAVAIGAGVLRGVATGRAAVGAGVAKVV